MARPAFFASACQDGVSSNEDRRSRGLLGVGKMTISFERPQAIEQELRTGADDLSREAKEAFLIELYRQEKIAQHQLAEALGLDRYETDGALKRH